MLQWLFEKYIKTKRHEFGTYVSVELNDQGKEDLYNWCVENKISNLTSPSEYHATVIYSRKGIPQVKSYKFDLPVNAKITGWEIFPTQSGTKCLVARIESKVLTSTNKDITTEFGATSDFPDYKPHVTVSYDYDKTVAPKTFPNMSLKFDRVRIEPLDPDKKMKTDD